MDAQAADFQNLLETNGIKPKKIQEKRYYF